MNKKNPLLFIFLQCFLVYPKLAPEFKMLKNVRLTFINAQLAPDTKTFILKDVKDFRVYKFSTVHDKNINSVVDESL